MLEFFEQFGQPDKRGQLFGHAYYIKLDSNEDDESNRINMGSVK